MAPYDPHCEPASMPTTHERLQPHLDLKDSDVTIKIKKIEGDVVLALPNEILDLIFTHVTSKHDLAQVCKASRRFFATGTRVLYRDVRIYISSTLDPNLAQLFNSENSGLQFVKHISVSLDNNGARDPAAQWLTILTNQLPPHQLESFSINPPLSISSRVFQTLWQRQRNLKRLEVIPTYMYDTTHDNDVDLLMTINNTNFPALKTLRLVPDGPDTAFLGCAALQRGRISALEVDGLLFHANHNDDDEDEDDAESEADPEDPLVASLFDHLQKSVPGQPAPYSALSSLKLKDINLEECKTSWLIYLDLANLKHLSIEHCRGADIFLMQISSGAATPGLHTFTLLHQIGDDEDRTIHGVEELLRYPRHTLRKLELCLRNTKRMPKIDTICKHSRTLQVLMLDLAARTNNTVCHEIYPITDFKKLIEECHSLEELGIALPTVQLEETVFMTGQFCNYIRSIIRHLALRRLNILNWPQDYTHGQDAGYYAAKIPQVARIAAEIFSEHRRYDAANRQHVKFDINSTINLDVVAFGVRARDYRFPAPLYFVQSEVFIPWKPGVFHAQEVDFKYVTGNGMAGELLGYEKRDFEEGSRANIYGQSFDDDAGW